MLFLFVLLRKSTQEARGEGGGQERRPGEDPNRFSYCFNQEINTRRRRRGRRPGEDLNGVSYCFIKEINTGGKRSGREDARRGSEWLFLSFY